MGKARRNADMVNKHGFSLLSDAVAFKGFSNGDTLVISEEGRGGNFVFTTDALTEDNGTIFAVTTGGFLKRLYDGTIQAEWFDVKGDGNNDAPNIIKALNALDDGDTLDFNGLECSVYNNVGDIPTSPTGEALPLDEVLRLYQKKNITLQNGKIYAYNPTHSGVKYIYPTTLSFDNCENIVLNNMIIESKGQSYGDTDASSPLGFDARAIFASQNGGHAVLASTCKGVTANNCQFRRAGSVAVVYTPSSTQVQLNNCFINADSLGYAAYNMDTWTGDRAHTGFGEFTAGLNDCSVYVEGAGTYSSKGCILGEGDGIRISVKGGLYKDAFANSASGVSKDLGYAFNANACKMYVDGATVENCASFGATGQTTVHDGELYVSNCTSKNLRKTVHQVNATSFGSQIFKYTNCDFFVTGTGVWAGDGSLAREHSTFVANMKAGSSVTADFISCTLTGAEYAFINEASVFGTLRFQNCSIRTEGYFCDSKGWGGASAYGTFGISVASTDIYDGSTNTDSYFKYANLEAPSNYTHVDIDFDASSSLGTITPRPISGISIAGTDLVRRLSFSSRLKGFHELTSLINGHSTAYVFYNDLTGVAGANTKCKFEYPSRYSNYPFSLRNAAGQPIDIAGVETPAYINAQGNVEVIYYINTVALGTPWAVGARITCTFINTYDYALL